MTPSSTAAARTTPRWGDGWVLAAFLAVVTVVAAGGALATGDAGATYDRLDLPAFAPPSWLFGPVWSVLYVAIAVSGWLYWRSVRSLDGGLVLYGAQLVLNAVWTPLFFAADSPVVALVDIALLAVLVAATAVVFRRRSRAAAWLLVPYLLWVLYAAALNTGIVVLN